MNSPISEWLEKECANLGVRGSYAAYLATKTGISRSAIVKMFQGAIPRDSTVEKLLSVPEFTDERRRAFLRLVFEDRSEGYPNTSPLGLWLQSICIAKLLTIGALASRAKVDGQDLYGILFEGVIPQEKTASRLLAALEPTQSEEDKFTELRDEALAIQAVTAYSNNPLRGSFKRSADKQVIVERPAGDPILDVVLLDIKRELFGDCHAIDYLLANALFIKLDTLRKIRMGKPINQAVRGLVISMVARKAGAELASRLSPLISTYPPIQQRDGVDSQFSLDC